jgi:hypothetical protein
LVELGQFGGQMGEEDVLLLGKLLPMAFTATHFLILWICFNRSHKYLAQLLVFRVKIKMK